MSRKVFEGVTAALTALATAAVAIVGAVQPPHAELAQPIIVAVLGAAEAIMGLFIKDDK